MDRSFEAKKQYRKSPDTAQGAGNRRDVCIKKRVFLLEKNASEIQKSDILDIMGL